MHGSPKLLHICSTCQMGKSSQLPFAFSFSYSSFPLELLHTDIWGYSPTPSINGSRYYVTFIDDYSRYCWLFPIQFKSQVYDIFVSFKPFVENMFERKIKCIQCDGSGEFTSHQFKTILSKNGISHRISCPHTPAQNRLAERKVKSEL